MKKEFTDDAKQYLICKHIRISPLQWGFLNDNEQQVYIKKELWIKKNAQVRTILILSQ